jgi:acetylornithine/succinyldiaminopimelate/putrescine aminotransferase
MVFRKDWASWFSRNDPVFVSSTGFGNAISLAAADAVLDVWSESDVNQIWQLGNGLMDGLTAIGYTVIGHGPRSLVQLKSKAERGYFCKAMADRGILLNRPNFPNLAHAPTDVALTIQAAQEAHADMVTLGPDGIAAEMQGREPMQLFEGR